MSSATLSPDRLTHEQLHERMLRLARTEREATLSVIDHLIEIQSQRVHQRRGHSSLYSYCIDELGYSRGAAHLRIVAARTVRRWPRVRRLLAERRLTLSTLAAVSDSLTPDNYRHLLNRVCGKSQQEVERILAELHGVRPSRERISQVTTVARGDSGVGTRLGLGRVDGPGRNAREQTAGSGPGSTTSRSQADAEESVTAAAFAGRTQSSQPLVGKQVPMRRVERRYRYEFTGSEAFMRKYQRAASLLSNRLPGGVTIEAVFEKVLDEFLERNDPTRREERRRARRLRRNGGDGSCTAGGTDGGNGSGTASKTSGGNGSGTASKTSGGNEPDATDGAMAGGASGNGIEAAHTTQPATGVATSEPPSTTQPVESKSVATDAGGHTTGHTGGVAAADGGDTGTAPSQGRRIPGEVRDTGAAPSQGRRIPGEVRDRVYARDGGQCTFRGTDGRRCRETRQLQYDHIIPWALGGGHTPENLRLLCAAHNQLQAERMFGAEHIARAKGD